ncbi:MAG: hypothetical protein ACM31C_23900 [Acidobacteriota bacterium]
MRALATVVVLVLAGEAARADELEDARKLEVSLEYEKALVLVDNAIARGGLDARKLAQLHLEAGKLAAGLDHPEAARDHFARALAIDPSVELPAGTSPKLVEPFEAARSHTSPLQVQVARARDQVMVGANDPLGLVASVDVRAVDDRGREQHSQGRLPFVATLPPRAREVTVVALDAHGNRLAEQHLAPEPERIAAASASGTRETPWFGRWPVWTAVAGVAAASGGFSAWRFSVAQDDWNRLAHDTAPHDYSQLRAIEDRGRSWALAANISFAVAGTAAIAAVIAGVVGFGGDDTTPAITAGPGTVGVAGRF